MIMKKQYKGLMLDLDGTTIQNRMDSLPSRRVIDAIAKAKKKLHVTIATGRALWQAAPILDVLQLSTPIILLNGALIVDGISRKLIYDQPLRKEDYKIVTKMLEKTKLHFTVDEHEETNKYTSNYEPEKPLTIFVWDLVEAQADELIQKLIHVPTIALYKTVGWKDGTVGLNISHINATKQHGILEVSRILGIETHELIGVGDAPNDFPLLMACGFKVAMGNAIPDLKAIADYIAPSVDEDGVADVIEKFVL